MYNCKKYHHLHRSVRDNAYVNQQIRTVGSHYAVIFHIAKRHMKVEIMNVYYSSSCMDESE